MQGEAPPSLPMTGGCQCGTLRYQVDAAPLGCWACHCNECRKQSGSAFGLSMLVPLAAFRFVSGEPAVWTRLAASGNLLDCLFCAACGSRIAHRRHMHEGRITLKPGTLDDPRWIQPARHFFVEEALPWTEPLRQADAPADPDRDAALGR
jgi:hypothetical protein